MTAQFNQGVIMTNLDFIIPQLATGGDLPANQEDAVRVLQEWRTLGITHVVDNRFEWNDDDLVAEHCPEIHYLHHGVDDAGQQMPDWWFDLGTEWVRGALRDPDAKVLVHCHMGINRGPSMAYASLLMLGHDPIEAMTMIRSARPIAAIGYAEDALDWHHRTDGASRHQQLAGRQRLEAWREANWIDVVRIIREIRATEAA
jgi:dual specificity phosphatase 3